MVYASLSCEQRDAAADRGDAGEDQVHPCSGVRGSRPFAQTSAPNTTTLWPLIDSSRTVLGAKPGKRTNGAVGTVRCLIVERELVGSDAAVDPGCGIAMRHAVEQWVLSSDKRRAGGASVTALATMTFTDNRRH